MGFQAPEASEIQKSVTDMVLSEVKRTFNPEFLNRIDEIIVFDPLTDDDLGRITQLLIDDLNRHLAVRDLRVTVAPEVVDWIITATCSDRSYGARPLRRAIQRYIEDPLSEELIRGRLATGVIEIYLDHGNLTWRATGKDESGRPLAVTV
jgi:ATP-dependent Clp protease ATP-binding subunit ClpC